MVWHRKSVYIGAPNSGTKALPLHIQSPQLRTTGFFSLCRGSAFYSKCGWVPSSHEPPWKDLKSKIDLQAVCAMAYIERPGNVCDQQTLRRVQKGWAPRYTEWIHEPTIDGKHAQLLRRLVEIHAALSQRGIGEAK